MKFSANENLVLAGDFNINLFDFENNKVKNFSNLLFQYSMIAAVNKAIRVTENTTTAIDHLITICLDNGFKSIIIKTYISDNIPIIFAN